MENLESQKLLDFVIKEVYSLQMDLDDVLNLF